MTHVLRRSLQTGLIATVGLLGFSVSAPAQAPELAMLDRIEPGLWAIAPRGGERPAERVCISDARMLLQIRHNDQALCRRFIIADEPDEVTVSYRCGGGEQGRTTIKYETNSLVRIDTQGIANASPFRMAGEGRRVGSC